MRVTKLGECGILCSMFLAYKQGDGAIGAPEIAESQGLDLQYTQQVLHHLRKGNIIESVRGPKGGYRLARDAAKITLKEILYAAEGDTFEIICDYAPIRPVTGGPIDGVPRCSTSETCGLHTVWMELKDAINQLLDQRTLADLTQKNIEATGLIKISDRQNA